MSVLIKGMEMPKCCTNCKYSYSEPLFGIQRCKLTDLFIEDYSNDFPESCPLVELPEHHGGLIDVDAACDDFDTVNPIYQYWIDWAKRCLRAAQVLVEAE